MTRVTRPGCAAAGPGTLEENESRRRVSDNSTRGFPSRHRERTAVISSRIRLPNRRSVITGSTPSCWLAMGGSAPSPGADDEERSDRD